MGLWEVLALWEQQALLRQVLSMHTQAPQALDPSHSQGPQASRGLAPRHSQAPQAQPPRPLTPPFRIQSWCPSTPPSRSWPPESRQPTRKQLQQAAVQPQAQSPRAQQAQFLARQRLRLWPGTSQAIKKPYPLPRMPVPKMPVSLMPPALAARCQAGEVAVLSELLARLHVLGCMCCVCKVHQLALELHLRQAWSQRTACLTCDRRVPSTS